jgi:hypothetical protein
MGFAGVNYSAVVVAALAGWLIGALWYMVLAKPWQEAAGVTGLKTKAPKEPGFYLPFIYAFFALVVMGWVLAGLISHLGPGQFTVRNGVFSGAICWLGFVFTTMMVNNSFAGRDRRLLLIDGGHWLIVLLVMGAILGAFGGA